MHAGESRHTATLVHACMHACMRRLAVRAPWCVRLGIKESPVQLRRGATRVSGLLIISDGQVWLPGKKEGGNWQKKVIMELIE